MPAVVLVVLGSDAGGGFFAETDVDTEGGQVPVAEFGLELGGAAALGREVGQPGVAQLMEVYPVPCGSWSLDACLNRYSARG